jgi:hypothetical protein
MSVKLICVVQTDTKGFSVLTHQPSWKNFDYLGRLRQKRPKVCDMTFQSMPEKARRDLIIGTNRHWPELLAVNKES